MPLAWPFVEKTPVDFATPDSELLRNPVGTVTALPLPGSGAAVGKPEGRIGGCE